MINIKKISEGDFPYYDFTLVKNDTGQFIATPKVDGEEYILQAGDEINFHIAKKVTEEPILEIVADSENRISITAENSAQLPVGDYYADITLDYNSGERDTFIRIPTSNGKAFPNFHVTYGV